MMQLIQKLKLSEYDKSIHFFKEGMFVQVFYVSLYIVITQLKLNIKVTGYRYYAVDNQLILRAGLPVSLLLKKLPNLVKTEYGYRLDGEWNISEYQSWYQTQLRAWLQQEKNKNSIVANNQMITSFNAMLDATPNIKSGNTHLLALTAQQTEFLLHWQVGKYPSSVDAGFILGLKQQLMLKKH